jgi:hypothetical protein
MGDWWGYSSAIWLGALLEQALDASWEPEMVCWKEGMRAVKWAGMWAVH